MTEQQTQLKVLVYYRISTDTDTQTFASQEYVVRQFCARKNYKILHEFYDEASATDLNNREQWSTLLEVCRETKHKPYAIVAARLDRVVRSLAQYVDIVRELDDLKISLVTTDFDLTGLPDYLIEFFKQQLVAFAQLERNIIKSRVKEGIAAARERGITLGRPSKQDNLDSELNTIRRMLKANMTYGQIAKALEVSQSTLRRYLRKFE